MARGPFALVRFMAGVLDDLEVPYALGGSMASSLLGEPPSTVDIDMAVSLDEETGEALLERVRGEFYVPIEAARAAVRAHASFNLVDTEHALEVDLFVAGSGLLDRMQLQRRVLVELPGAPGGVWVTSAEDQVLRKLDWFERGGGVSDRQWRDVQGLLRVHGDSMDASFCGPRLRRPDSAPRCTGRGPWPVFRTASSLWVRVLWGPLVVVETTTVG